VLLTYGCLLGVFLLRASLHADHHPLSCAEPEKQFALIERHIASLRRRSEFAESEVIVMVERNLGFEAEHHERALNGIPGTRHRIDHQAKRYGVLTTQDIKYGMMTLLNTMLRDQRINISPDLVSDNAAASSRRLKEQLCIYSFQFKSASSTFGRQQVALNGKVGGMKDDLCIALQLAVYFSAKEQLYA
jgi:hypothetical protein